MHALAVYSKLYFHAEVLYFLIILRNQKEKMSIYLRVPDI